MIVFTDYYFGIRMSDFGFKEKVEFRIYCQVITSN